MDEQHVFHTVFRGFRKQDVLDYIDSLLAKQQEERDEWQAQRERLSTAAVPAPDTTVLDELTSQLQQRQEETAVLQKHNDELEGQLAALQNETSICREQNRNLSAQLEQARQALSALWEEESALRDKAGSADAFAGKLVTTAERLIDELKECIKHHAEYPAEANPEETTGDLSSVPADEQEQKPVDEPEKPIVRAEDATLAGEMDRWLF